MRKGDLNLPVFQNRNRCSPKSDRWCDRSEKEIQGYGVNFWKTEALHADLNERVEAATSSCSATSNFWQYIYSVLLAKNHQTISSRSLVHEFRFTDIFNDINHGYKAVILRRNHLWLLPFYMPLATYCYYKRVRKTMCTSIVS